MKKKTKSKHAISPPKRNKQRGNREMAARLLANLFYQQVMMRRRKDG